MSASSVDLDDEEHSRRGVECQEVDDPALAAGRERHFRRHAPATQLRQVAGDRLLEAGVALVQAREVGRTRRGD